MCAAKNYIYLKSTKDCSNEFKGFIRYHQELETNTNTKMYTGVIHVQFIKNNC